MDGNNKPFEELVIKRLDEISEDLKKLWEAQHEMTVQIANLSNPANCEVKHNALKEDIYKHYKEEKDQSHEKRSQLLQIFLGSGSLLILWELIKYIFKIKG